MIEKERTELARRADLPAVLTRLGAQLRPEGRGFSVLPHSSLKLFQLRGVWLYKWWSRNGEVGDGIQFLRRYHQMSFSEAADVLSGSSGRFYKPVYTPPEAADRPQPAALKAGRHFSQWQARAEKLVQYAGRQLFTPGGGRALTYLIHKRGLSETAVRGHGLGRLPPKDHMPSKLVIPCRDTRGSLIRVRFRMDDPRPDGSRYRVMKGSCTHSPFPLGFSPGKPIVWLESELDGMLVHQAAGTAVGVLALGSAAVKLHRQVLNYLARRVPLNLICLDNDACGRRRIRDLLQMLPNAAPWPVPAECGKDPGEAWPHLDLKTWADDGVKWGIRQIRR